MNYYLAILAGRLALGLTALAPVYYLARTLLTQLLRRGGPAAAPQLLRDFVGYARRSHPYLASALVLAAAYHAGVMLPSHALSSKVGLGVGAATMLTFMLASGWTLKFSPAASSLRTSHRGGMYLFVALVIAHRFLAA